MPKAKKKTAKTKGKNIVRKRSFPKTLSNVNSTYKCIIECMYQVYQPATGAAGYTDIAVNACLNRPTYGRVASGPGQFPVFPALYTNCVTVFDTYRVHKLQTTFVPNVVDTQTFGYFVNADAPSLMYVYNDPDDEALVTSETLMLNGGVRPLNWCQGKTIKHTFVNKDKGFYNTGSISLAPTATTTNNANLKPLTYASTKVYFPQLYHNAAAGQPCYFGRLYFRWYVEWKSAKTA